MPKGEKVTCKESTPPLTIVHFDTVSKAERNRDRRRHRKGEYVKEKKLPTLETGKKERMKDEKNLRIFVVGSVHL